MSFIFSPLLKYVWYSVLLYDKEYRDMQADEKFEWGTYRQDLRDFQLVSKRDNPTARANNSCILAKPHSSMVICLEFSFFQLEIQYPRQVILFDIEGLALAIHSSGESDGEFQDSIEQQVSEDAINDIPDNSEK
jgi:hypothetical protein